MENYQTNDGFSGATLTLVSILTLAAGVILGYFYGAGTFETESILGTTDEMQEDNKTNTTTNNNGENDTNMFTDGNENEPAFSIVVADLPEGQRTALRTFGIEEEEIVITRGTAACAEASIGTDRMAALQNGATPTATEGVTLVGCYTTNQ
jgi:hypothetical protein